MIPVPAGTGVAKRAHDPTDAKRKRTCAPTSQQHVEPSRVDRVPLPEALCAAVMLASATAQFVPNTHLFAFVPLHSICDPPLSVDASTDATTAAPDDDDVALASDNDDDDDAADSSDNDDVSTSDDDESSNSSSSQDDDDASDDSDSVNEDDSDDDGNSDDDAGDVDVDHGKVGSADDKRTEVGNHAAQNATDDDDDVSCDDDYADDWDGDSSDDDEDEEDDDESRVSAKANGSAKESGNHQEECDATNDDIDAPIELFDGVWVLASHAPTMYTSAEAALGAALAQRRSRRVPLQGIIVEFRPLREPPIVRVTEQMLAVANLNNTCDDDDDDDDALFATPLSNGVAPGIGADETSVPCGTGGNGAQIGSADDEDEEDGIQGVQKDEDIDDAQLFSEDDLRAPDPMDKIVVGPPPAEPFPCQRRMAFHVRRYAQGRPAVPECEFAAMYHMSLIGHMGWIDVDVRGTSCIRAHWKAVTKHMVYCGDVVVGAAEVAEFVNMQMTDVLGEPIVSDTEKFSVLYALRPRIT